MIERRMAALLLAGATLAGCSAGADTTPPPLAATPAGSRAPMGLHLAALQGGAFLMQTAQLGVGRARSPELRRFCEFEASEQRGLVQAMGLAGHAVTAPPALPPAKMAMVQGLSDSRGAAFDRMLLAAQQRGHSEALETFAALREAGGTPADGVLALLAEDRIREHLAMLQMLRA
ncbi:DUF4142 domain-containing protein [Pseudoroseomonas globiformis]|uniref:DUF4142 domain-containing protein n=1 Tax=Teichococcus globiformis TaxID=2307229 RepID=A0ABV7FXF6_9PROT